MAEDLKRVSSFLADFILMTGSIYISIYVVALVGSTEDVAALRGGLLLYSPVDTVVAGVRILALPVLARSLATGRQALRIAARRLMLVYLLVAGGWSILVIALPDRVGKALLGKTWVIAGPLLPLLAVACAGRYAVFPALDGIRAHGGGRQLVSVRVLTTALTFSSVVIGTAVDGSLGAAGGLAAAYIFEAGLWWQSFGRRNRGGTRK
jgi:O-antigen/teichoic acid export membrane protein